MQPDAFARSNAVPDGRIFGATKNKQQLVVSVCLCISIATILRCVSLLVRGHPDLQAPHSLLVMVELLQCISNITVGSST